ncbi:MAG: ankyrin repeat domain-containing protein [Candidatus Rifleibacteriota bacterium]
MHKIDAKNLAEAGNFPTWAMVLGCIMASMGLYDYFNPFDEILVSPGFVFFLVCMGIALNRFGRVSRAGFGWLMWAVVGWGFLDFFVLFVFTISAGMTRDYLASIAFRAPSWILFGSWLVYCGYQIRKSHGGAVGANDAAGNAATAFRFSALLLVIFIFLSDFTIVSMRLSENQTVTLGPIGAEYMLTEKSGAGFGKLGFFSHIQKVAEEETGRKGNLPWLGFWWFPAQLLLLPLTWIFAGRGCWKKLAFLFVLGLVALFSIPVQLAMQYGLSPFGKEGFIQSGYFVMFFPLFFQIWGFRLSRLAKDGMAEKAPIEQEPAPAVFPAKVSLIAIAVTLIWTFSLPVLQRSPLDSMVLAAQNGQREKFPVLLEALKSQVKQNPVEIALCHAIDERQKDLVAWLLTLKPELNKKPDKRSEMPLWWAIRGSGDLEITKMLLEAGADPNIDLYEGSAYIENTPLGLALGLHWSSEGIKYLQLLASFGANLDQPVNKEGNYPVEFVLRRSSYGKNVSKFVQEFKRLGGNPLLQGPDNLFGLALSQEDPEVLNFLMSLGLNSRVVDKNGNSYLHLRVERTDFNWNLNLNDREKQFASDVINSRNSKGLTALHLAVEKNHPQMVEELLKLGADPEVKSDEGLSALEMAKSNKSLKLVAIIEEFLAAKK